MSRGRDGWAAMWLVDRAFKQQQTGSTPWGSPILPASARLWSTNQSNEFHQKNQLGTLPVVGEKSPQIPRQSGNLSAIAYLQQSHRSLSPQRTMPAMRGMRYCDIVWLSVFGLFIADFFAVVVVLIRVRIVWLRIVVLIAGVALFFSFPFILVFSGCGIV